MSQLTAEEQLKALQEENARLKQANAEQEEIINDQVEKLELAEAGKGKALPVVAHKKEKYQILAAKFHFGGKDHTAAELAENPDLIAALVKAGSGILNKID